MSDSPTPVGALAVVLNQRSSVAPFHREAVVLQGDEHPGKALGFDGNGALGAIAVGASSATVVSPVDTIAALRARSVASVATGAQVNVAGYHTPMDGGGGVFCWDAASAVVDNGGTVIKPTSVLGPGRWMRILDCGPLNVRWFGAMGNNSNNDQPAIQAAIVAAFGTAWKNNAVYMPTGRYRIYSGLNLTGYSTGQINIFGDGCFATQIHPAFNGGTAFDLTGAHKSKLRDFGFYPGYDSSVSASFVQQQVILLARPAGNASSGEHHFLNVWIHGACSNAIVVVWASEINTWEHCRFYSLEANVPTLTAAVKISDTGINPTSVFTAVGTGEGGCGANTFLSCQFYNSLPAPTAPMMKLFGTLNWQFYGCYWYNDGPKTIEVNHSTYHDVPPTGVSYGSLVFDACYDESTNARTGHSSIWFSPPVMAGRASVQGLIVRNCVFFNIKGEDNTIVDGLVYESGRYSPSLADPTGEYKIDLWQARNSHIRPSACEKFLFYRVRNGGYAITITGTDPGVTTLTGVTGSTVIDSAGRMGMGIAAPVMKLDVWGSPGANDILRLSGATSADDPTIVFLNGTGGVDIARLKADGGSGVFTLEAIGKVSLAVGGNIEATTTSFEALTAGQGFILKSPDGTRWRIQVANTTGALSTTPA